MAPRRKLEAKTTTLQKDPRSILFDHKPKPTSQSGITEIACAEIYVPSRQVRKYFNPDAEQELIQSIADHGVLEPILVRPLPEERQAELSENYKYELVFGERRLRASIKAKRKTIPAVTRELSDSEMLQIQLDENLQREGLSLLEKLEGVLDLLAVENGKTRKQIESDIQNARNDKRRKGELTGDVAGQLESYRLTLERHGAGTPDGFISQLQKFRRMPEEVYQAAFEGKIDASKGIEISPIKDNGQRKKLLNWLIEENPSVKEIRKRVRALRGEKEKPTELEAKTQTLLKRAQKIKTWKTLPPILAREVEDALAALEAALLKLNDNDDT